MERIEIWLTRAVQNGSFMAYCVLWLHIKSGRKLCDKTQVQLIKMLDEGSLKAKKLLFLYRKNRSLCFDAWQEFAKLNEESNSKVRVLLDAGYYWYMRSNRTPDDFSKYVVRGLVEGARLRQAFWSLS